MAAPFSISTGQPAPLGKFSYRKSIVLPFPPLSADHKRQSDLAIVTWVAGEAALKWFSVTGPAMRRYAEKTGADFIAIEGYSGQPYSLSNKFRVRQVFDQYGYDAVLFVDADALIRDECVNFFELVPSNHVGILDEGPYYDEWMLANYRREASALLLSQGLGVDYEEIPSPKNSGLYLIPATQREVLAPFERPFPVCSRDGATVEQTWLTLKLHQQRSPLFLFDHPKHHWIWYADQKEEYSDDAMVLHFAGLRDEGDVRYKRLIEYAHKDGMDGNLRVGGPKGSPSVAVTNFDRQMMLEHPAPAALKMLGAHTISVHRYGWKVAVKALSVLADPDGVALDSFIESTFLYHAKESFQARIAPYRQPWMGFIHNPPGVPDWPSISEGRPQNLSRNPLWLESLPYCLGLFTLSDYLATWVRNEWGIPCEVLRYPTLTPDQLFSMDTYEEEPCKIVTTIGFWLRRFTSFSRLRADGFRKVRPMLMPSENAEGMSRIRAYEEDESSSCKSGVIIEQPIEDVPRLSGRAYDKLLSKAVVFLDLIDASAVTTIVECIVRGTPLLVNRLPSVVEYLGRDYPLYFDTLEEAAAKLADSSLVCAAHEHMRSNPLAQELTPQAFLDAFANSEIYKKAVALRQPRMP